MLLFEMSLPPAGAEPSTRPKPRPPTSGRSLTDDMMAQERWAEPSTRPKPGRGQSGRSLI